MRRSIFIAAALLASLAATTGAMAQIEKGPTKKLNGEVIAVRTQAGPGDQGEFTEVKVRTRLQEEHWLRLGSPEEFGERQRVGDRVRVRVIGGGDGEPALVREMHNYRTGESLRIRDRSGEMLQQRDRDRLQDRAGDRSRDRVHQPDSSGSGGMSGGGRRGGRR